MFGPLYARGYGNFCHLAICTNLHRSVGTNMLKIGMDGLRRVFFLAPVPMISLGAIKVEFINLQGPRLRVLLKRTLDVPKF